MAAIIHPRSRREEIQTGEGDCPGRPVPRRSDRGMAGSYDLVSRRLVNSDTCITARRGRRTTAGHIEVVV